MNRFDLFEEEGWNLDTDMYEDDGDVIVEVHVPGVHPEKIGVEVEDNYLRISGERGEEKDTEGKTYFRQEIEYGDFERTIALPCQVDPSKSRASVSNGVLTIVMPKKFESRANRIQVTRK